MNQQLLFRNIEETYLSIDDVASQLEVSTASVRNWVKTGYLDQTGRGVISRESFENFKTVVAGCEKLTARANKSLKDTHDHEELQRQFDELLKKDKTDLNNIGLRYEESLSNAYRNKEGIYYTPIDITERFFQYLPENNSRLSFCDPCCGSGNFILTAIENGFRPENIYGYDIDPIAVEITKRRIFKRTGYQTNKIICVDFLESILDRNRTCFDIIVTNPPWGKKITNGQKREYARLLRAGTSTDTSSLFFFGCLSRLKENGYLGLLLQDAFFNVASFECARKQTLSLNIIALLDFGKPFKGLLTKAKGIIAQQQKAINGGLVQCLVHQKSTVRLQDSFNKNPKSILNFSCSSDESEVIEHLYRRQHLTLSGKAKYGLGIVTGNNKKFCIKEKREGYIPVYRGADIHKDGINDPSNYVPDDLSLYQQVAPKDLFMAKEKLIYRFISSELIFYHDTQQRIFLNSVNMLVLENDFPINAKQLSKILNSRVLSWLFKSIFETHKVLRSDIESLPIHTKYFDDHPKFTEESFINYLGVEENHNGTFRIKK
ncbi:TaqI-like C-terminal specificity domain-containing protein [Candidatus Spongiihabitans sp.]|uniref:TaqI-like C-terminal specificity domain-containing protein n=1 Tax=Candidatus Spongiihabitans sp. TaxID=3101308 RepID=UPI003C7029CF